MKFEVYFETQRWKNKLEVLGKPESSFPKFINLVYWFIGGIPVAYPPFPKPKPLAFEEWFYSPLFDMAHMRSLLVRHLNVECYFLGASGMCLLCTQRFPWKTHRKWVDLRENLQEKLGFLYSKMSGVPIDFPLNQVWKDWENLTLQWNT